MIWTPSAADKKNIDRESQSQAGPPRLAASKRDKKKKSKEMNDDCEYAAMQVVVKESAFREQEQLLLDPPD